MKPLLHLKFKECVLVFLPVLFFWCFPVHAELKNLEGKKMATSTIKVSIQEPLAGNKSKLELEYQARNSIYLFCQHYDWWNKKWVGNRKKIAFESAIVPSMVNKIFEQKFSYEVSFGLCDYELNFLAYSAPLPLSIKNNFADQGKLPPASATSFVFSAQGGVNTRAKVECRLNRVDTAFEYVYQCSSDVDQLNLKNSEIYIDVNAQSE